MNESVHLLSQVPGYIVLVAVGALFALGIVLATKLMSKYLDENAQSTEMFMVANRNVGVGLTASAVYSSWTWATEFLWTVTMVYNYGIMGAFWFGAGLTAQICLMSVLGIEAKKKIPASHTSLEIVSIRYGTYTHILYMFLCLINNLISCSWMIFSAAGAISIIAGDLHIVASCMLIPFGVLLYTTVGGLKSTFLTDFAHSFIILIILCYINTAVLCSPHIGGIGGLYDLVMKNDADRYVKGNYMGSFLTGKSKGAAYFGVIHITGNFGLTVMDSSFWQKSFSANLHAQIPGYLIAAVTVFANVWALGSIIGLASIVLEDSPIFPTYPRKMTYEEISNGFGCIYVLKAVLGNGSLGAMLLVLYLAVTSTVSAQLISVSSIISFDIYRKYFKPDATNKQLIRVSHVGVVFFGFFSAGFTVMLFYVGADLTWLGYMVSMIICPGVIPLVLTITWSRQTTIAAFVSPVLGIIFGITVWLTTAYHWYGDISLISTGQQKPCLYGGLVAILLPGISSVLISLLYKPSKFDWEKFKAAQLIVVEEPQVSEFNKDEHQEINELNKQFFTSATEGIDISSQSDLEQVEQDNDKKLKLYTKIAYGSMIGSFLVTFVVWPLPLYRDWIWSKAFFRGWIGVSVFWVYLALIAIGLFPIWDGRQALMKVGRGFWKDYISKK